VAIERQVMPGVTCIKAYYYDVIWAVLSTVVLRYQEIDTYTGHIMKRYDPLSDRVAENIARLRHERDYSGAMLAERCIEFGRSLEPPIESNMTFGIISKIENGDRTVSISEMVLFAGALTVTCDALMGTASNACPETPDPTLEARVALLEEKVAGILGQS